MLRTVVAASLGLLTLLGVGCQAGGIRAEEAFTLNVPWNAYETVQVRSRNGRIEVRQSTDATQVSISGKKYVKGATLEEAQGRLAMLLIQAAADPAAPSTLVVVLEVPDEIRNHSPGASLVLNVPQACRIDVKTSNGAVVVAGMKQTTIDSSNGGVDATRIDGPLAVHTSNGTIRVADVHGDATLKTSNGAAVVERVQGSTRVEASNGDITLEAAGGPVYADTSNGSIRLVGSPPPDGSVQLDTSNGSIEAKLPASLKGELSLVTSNGKVVTDLGSMALTNPQITKTSVKGVMNGGGTGKLIARTSNGGIRLTCQ